MFGVKKTHELIPDCHPLPVEHAEVGFTVGEQEINRHHEGAHDVPHRRGWRPCTAPVSRRSPSTTC
ncbi:MAG: hypothetical protein R2810_15225 [Flavobacteriales bacterium]